RTRAAEVCSRQLSHSGAEDERLVNGGSPPPWSRYPSLSPTNTLHRPSRRFAHRRPEPVSAFLGGRARISWEGSAGWRRFLPR
ncbi:unnamed protein product, partial [Tetraodon nigroviridis]